MLEVFYSYAAHLHVSIDLHASVPSPTGLFSYAHGFSSYARGFSIYAIGFCFYAKLFFLMLPSLSLCSIGQVGRGGLGCRCFRKDHLEEQNITKVAAIKDTLSAANPCVKVG